MQLSKVLALVNLPDLIAQTCGTEAMHGLSRERGGVIRDPRPGHSETRPSFSVFLSQGRWGWKRHDGSDSQKGNAYGFLLSLGYSETQAREELERLAGGPSSGWQPSGRSYVRSMPDPLEQAHGALNRCAALAPDERAKVTRLLSSLTEQDQAAQDLQARGLLGWPGLQVGTLRHNFQTREGRVLARAGALCFLLTGPDGSAWGLKVRNLGSSAELAAAGLDRYVYRLAGHGAPAWCSPTYKQGTALLVTEGELNGAAAARALLAAGLALDVQGLAGAGGVPHLEGMAGRVVYLYADPDAAGAACLERIGRIAQAAGAAEVRVLAPLEAGDFCNLAGTAGIGALGAALLGRIQASTIHHTVLPSGAKRGASFSPPHQTLGNGAMVKRTAADIALSKYRAKLGKKFRGLQ
ncbi:hypothetical protein [Deinococcus sp.]|uniref:hypothetical protein n=1 Tax=Deinococcus sp. TaxID=47478 RepID=UPI003CC56649